MPPAVGIGCSFRTPFARITIHFPSSTHLPLVRISQLSKQTIEQHLTIRKKSKRFNAHTNPKVSYTIFNVAAALAIQQCPFCWAKVHASVVAWSRFVVIEAIHVGCTGSNNDKGDCKRKRVHNGCFYGQLITDKRGTLGMLFFCLILR
jgi:hypothetical protein